MGWCDCNVSCGGVLACDVAHIKLTCSLPTGLLHSSTCSVHLTSSMLCTGSALLSNRLPPALSEGGNGESLFPSALHRALLQNLPLVSSATSAVGVRCFFDLLGATQAPEELTDTVQGLLQVCGSLLDSVGRLSVAPALQGLTAAE